MWLRLAVAAVFVVFLWQLFRFAVGLRWSKVSREAARRQAESGGGRVVAEIPVRDGVQFFVDEPALLRWGDTAVAKADLQGARLLLNGAVVGAVARDGVSLPPAPAIEDHEVRERWDVVLYLSGGGRSIPCGTLREGVSREIAAQVFEAVRRALLRP